jgi:hypothetical protein
MFLILVLDIVFRSYRDEPNSYRYFEVGITLGVGSLFYAPLAYLLIFIWFAVMVQRPFYWREFIFPLLGLLVPYIFVFAFLFFTDKSIPEFLFILKSNFTFDIKLPEYLWIFWIFIGYLVLLIIIATIYLLKVFQFRKIYIRDYFMVLFWLFITGLIIFAFFSGLNFRIIYMLAIPISYLLTNYFVNAKKSIGNKILIYVFLGYTLFLAIYYLKGNILK